MSAIPNDVFNRLFMDKLSTTEGQEKIAEYGGEYIRDHLREAQFSRGIIPPENISANDPRVQISMNHDTLVVLEMLEPQSRAMALNFRGVADVQLIRASRMEIPFFMISSLRFEAYEEELLVYRNFKLTKILEDNLGKDIGDVEDREFTIHVDAAVQALQQEANGGVVTSLHQTTIAAGTVVETGVRKGELARVDANNNAVVWPMQRPDVVSGHKLLDGTRRRCEKVLLSESDFDDINSWTIDDMGSPKESESLIDGFKGPTLIGRGYVRTIKTEILKPGNLYFFTGPEWLGRFYILNNVKFYIDKVGNKLTFFAWEDIALSLVNIASVRKVETYSGDATANDANGIRATVSPVAETALGAQFNRVDDGVFFPQVNFF